MDRAARSAGQLSNEEGGHVERDQNARADELANLALDNAESLLNDSEVEVAGKMVALLREHRISPPRTGFVLSKATRLLQDG